MEGTKMLRRYCAGLVTTFIAVPAFASLFNPSLSAEDAHQIKRLAIVSVMGDTVHGNVVGLTAFQNKSFDAAVPGWNLDATVTKDLVEHIVAGAKIGGEVVPLATSSTKESEILSEARTQGFDAVLVVLPEENVHDRTLGSGVTLLHRKLPGVDKVHPCIVGAVRVLRASDGKQIGAHVLDPCSYARNTLVWHNTWDAFSDEEKKAALAALQENALERLKLALVSLKLSDQ
jgi:hypothetical protein